MGPEYMKLPHTSSFCADLFQAMNVSGLPSEKNGELPIVNGAHLGAAAQSAAEEVKTTSVGKGEAAHDARRTERP